MKISNHTINKFPRVARVNKYICLFLSTFKLSCFIRHAFKCTYACCSDSYNSFSFSFICIQSLRHVILYKNLLCMHVMIFNVFYFDIRKGSKSNMESYIFYMYSFLYKSINQLRCKMKSCSRCCNTSSCFIIDSLIPLRILYFFLYIRRKWRVPNSVYYVKKSLSFFRKLNDSSFFRYLYYIGLHCHITILIYKMDSGSWF